MMMEVTFYKVVFLVWVVAPKTIAFSCLLDLNVNFRHPGDMTFLMIVYRGHIHSTILPSRTDVPFLVLNAGLFSVGFSSTPHIR